MLAIHMRKSTLSLLLLTGLLSSAPASAEVITLSSPQVTGLLTNTYVGSTTMHYSDPLTSFWIDGVTFEPFGATQGGSPYSHLRTTFDNRAPAPYSYDFINENVMQVASSGLRLEFDTPTTLFGFGAALNATASPSSMQVELFGPSDASLGTFLLTLDRTLVSTSGGTNSNSEGKFVAPPLGLISAVQILNFGDGMNESSQFHWVIDNVEFNPVAVPEPALLTLVLVGAAFMLTRRR
jgi:hypothetical protein